MKKTNHLKHAFIGLSALLLTACGNNDNLVGTWVQPVPGLPALQQGFVLEEGGTASSVNMATLRYQTWKQEGNSLILSGESVGNRQTIAFSDTLSIESLTRDSLIVKHGELVLRYARQDAAGQQEAPESIPAAVLTPAKQTQQVKGKLVIGHEVRSFTPEGSDEDYWIVDETEELYQRYDAATGGVKNGEPVFADLQIEDVGKSDEGFAADYKSVYKVHRINALHK